MTKRAHVDGERKPSWPALRALDEWLLKRSLPRAHLGPVLSANAMQISRIFNGTGCMSETQCRSVETLTDGVITAAMLQGRSPPPAKVPGPQKNEEFQVVQEPGPAKSREQIEKEIQDFLFRALPAAIRKAASLINDPEASKALQFKACEFIAEQVWGRPGQRVPTDDRHAPADASAVRQKIYDIAKRLQQAKPNPEEEGGGGNTPAPA